jgi:ABC-type molybdate transport system substrate-binding protein
MRVFVDTTLGECIKRLAHEFEIYRPGLDVQLEIGDGMVLAGELKGGAKADVLLAPGREPFELVAGSREIEQEMVVAMSRPMIAVPQGNPAELEKARDLARKETRVVLASESSELGKRSRELLDALQIRRAVEAHAVSEGLDTHELIATLRKREADAGIIFAADYKVHTRSLDRLRLPKDIDTEALQASFHVAALPDGPNPERAAGFAHFVRTEQARRMFRKCGFETI